jgi:hypothetical protein
MILISLIDLLDPGMNLPHFTELEDNDEGRFLR